MQIDRVLKSQTVQINPSAAAIDTSKNAPNAPQLDGTIKYWNIGDDPQNAVYRDGKITFVSLDLHTWSGQSTHNYAIRLVPLDVSQFFASTPKVSVTIDRFIGENSAADPAGSIFDYGWPAVAMNSQGDIVIGSVRSNPTIHQQLRASVWFHGEADIRSSILTSESSAPLLLFDMAGACADSASDAVYLAQQFADTSGEQWRVRVVEMLGDLRARNPLINPGV